MPRKSKKKNHALDDTELLPAVNRCYRLFSDPLLRRAFPQWIGHSKAIRGGTANAEEWYGVLVHQLLWKRLGLLVRNEQGCYQICHEIVADYLTRLDNGNAQRLLCRRRLRRILTIAAFLLCLSVGYIVYATYIRPPAYSELYEEPIFVYGLGGYSSAARQYEKMRTLVDCALETPEKFSDEKEVFDYFIDQSSGATNPEYIFPLIESMLETGEVFSWSRKKLDDVHYRELLTLTQERQEEYKLLASVLAYTIEDERGNRLYGGGYPVLLSELVDLDGQITATLYELVCVPHLNQTILEENKELLSLQKTIAVSTAGQSLFLSGETNLNTLNRLLLDLQGMRTSIRNKLNICGAIAAYQQKEGIL